MSTQELITTAMVVIGYLVVLCVLFQVAFATYGAYVSLGREKLTRNIRKREWEETRKRFALDRNQPSTSAWSGYRKFRVIKKQVEANDICSFYLAPHDEKPLPVFGPGQFLTFQLHIPGEGKKLQRVVRCYSLSRAHRPDAYRVTIKRLPQMADAPPGVVSNYFHDHICEDTILDVKAPSGKFVLDPQEKRPAVLIAGGVGITPLFSMLESVVTCGSQREVWLFYGVRHGGEHVLPEQLRKFNAEHDNLRVVIVYSSPNADDKQGHDYHEKGYINVELLRKYLGSNNYRFFVCGPPPMMAVLLPQMQEWGVPKDQIRTEAFGPASKEAKTRATAEPQKEKVAESHTIKFAKTQKDANWTGDYQNLLEFAEACNVEIDWGCKDGNCGTCEIAIRKGSVVYDEPPVYEVNAGCCLPCVAKPKEDVILDA